MNLCIVCREPNLPDLQFCSHCGTELLSLPRNQKGHLLPGVILQMRYQIKEVLGSGGFANAYLALDTRLHRACVVKEMLMPASASQEERRDMEQHFGREVTSLVALNHPGHPNIPEIYDYFLVPSGSYLVMKYIEGENLQQLLARLGGRLPWPEALTIVAQVCDALAYMHSRQPAPVLHRDIKPANILLDQANRIWLVDFGLSKAQPLTKRTVAGATTALGTAGYTALEQWMERAVPASDIYALGATLHHLLTGRDPRDAFDAPPDLPKVILEHSNFPPLRQFDESLPEEIEELVSAALHAESKERPTASQWKQEIEKLLHHHQFTALLQDMEPQEQNADLALATFLQLAQSEKLPMSAQARTQLLMDAHRDNMKSLLGFDGGLPATIWGGTACALLGVILWDRAAQVLLHGFEINQFALLGLVAMVNFLVGKLTFTKFTTFSPQEWQNSAAVHFLTGAINANLGLMIYMKVAGIYYTLSAITSIYFRSLLLSFSILLVLAMLDKALSDRMSANFRQNAILFAFGWPFILIGALWAIPVTIVRYLMYSWLNSSYPERK